MFDTNVFGVVAVTNAMLPLLRRSAAGRIVNMSSSMGSLAAWSDPESEFGANHQGYRTVEQGAAIAVKLATLDAAGPTGTFQNDDGALPW